MLRTLLAVLAITVFAGNAWAIDDATSESDAIQLDHGTQPNEPGSSMQKSPQTGDDPAEDRQMQESDVINQ